MTLALRLKELASKKSLPHLLQSIGVSKAQFYRYLKGASIPSDTLEKLAEAGDCSISWLLTGSEADSKSQVVKDLAFSEIAFRTFFDVLTTQYDGPMLRPSELNIALSLLMLNYRYKLQQGDSWQPKPTEMLEMLRFLEPMRKGSKLEVYYQTCLKIFTHGIEILDETWAQPFCALLEDALVHYYSQEPGKFYFARTHAPLNEAHLGFMKPFLQSLTQQSSTPQTLRLLDIGCGTGRHLSYIGRHYENFILTGVDPSPLVHPYMDNPYPSHALSPITFQQESVFNLSLASESQDAILCLFLLHYIPVVGDSRHCGVGKILAEISRILRPGGSTLITFTQSMANQFVPYLCFSHNIRQLEHVAKAAGLSPIENSVLHAKQSEFPGNAVEKGFLLQTSMHLTKTKKPPSGGL